MTATCWVKLHPVPRGAAVQTDRQPGNPRLRHARRSKHVDLRTRPPGQPERLKGRERGERGTRSAVDQRCLPRLVTCRWPVVGDDRPAPPLPAAGIERGDQLRRAAAELEKLRPGEYRVWCVVDEVASGLRGPGEHASMLSEAGPQKRWCAQSCGWECGLSTGPHPWTLIRGRGPGSTCISRSGRVASSRVQRSDDDTAPLLQAGPRPDSVSASQRPGGRWATVNGRGDRVASFPCRSRGWLYRGGNAAARRMWQQEFRFECDHVRGYGRWRWRRQLGQRQGVQRLHGARRGRGRRQIVQSVVLGGNDRGEQGKSRTSRSRMCHPTRRTTTSRT